MPNEKPTLNVVLGGVAFTAQLDDGTTAEVKVRQLNIRTLIEGWGLIQGDEAALVELYCGKEKGWDDKLLAESHDEIIRIGGELNRPRFARWTENRRADIANMQKATEGLPIPQPGSSSPTSSPPVASSSENPPPK